MSDLFNLEGKVAIVTGCNTGLGQAMAVALADAGCDIAGVNRSESAETQSKVESTGRQYHEIPCDLANQQELSKVVATCLNKYGRLDILVNNAGIIRRDDAIDFTERDWDEVMDVNLKSLFFLSQSVVKQFRKQDSPGKIINVASMLSFQGGIRVPSYTASKSGVLGLTKLMANEWAKFGINCNAIAPGYMETNNTEALRADVKRNEEILSRIPANRWGQPDDLAGPVVFLASEASSYVHGYTIAVDGGWLAR